MERGRARDLGVVIGTYPTGPLNAITDVEGVRVGQATVVRDPNPTGAARSGRGLPRSSRTRGSRGASVCTRERTC